MRGSRGESRTTQLSRRRESVSFRGLPIVAGCQFSAGRAVALFTFPFAREPPPAPWTHLLNQIHGKARPDVRAEESSPTASV